MKKHIPLAISTLLVITILLTSCGISTNELTSQVRSSMEEEFENTGIEIVSFMLTHRGGNDYKGVLETEEPNGNFKYSVDVFSDGDTFTWEIIQ